MTVEITVSPNWGYAGEEITFTATSGYDLYCIEFGDGEISYLNSDIHTYSKPGTYIVKVTVADANGHNIETDAYNLVIYEEGQEFISFRAKTKKGTAPFNVQFINESTTDADSVSWDFGDGIISTEIHPEHEYADPQVYTVTLTVTKGSTTKTLVKHNYIHVAEFDCPVSDFSHNLTGNSGSIPVSVEFTDESTGTITDSSWDFGDGATSTETNPIHIYTKAGYYFVKRIVQNADWIDERVQLFYIRPRDPTVRINASTESGAAPLTVTCIPIVLGAYLRLEWDFGDGTTSKEIRPSHTYSTPGTYTVTLTVWNTTTLYSVSATKTITVIDPANLPAAAFSGDVTEGAAPLTVTFTDASTGTPTSWLWGFGDGTTSTDQNPEHIYSTAGTYTVTLTVTNAYGSDTETKTGYITAGAGPEAAVSVDADMHYSSHEFSFTDKSHYNPTSWLWDFGDGETSAVQNPTHTFAAARSYWVTLTVTNAYGTDTIGIDITVLPASFPLPLFTYSTLAKKAPYLFKFTDTSQGTPTSWLWDFGDGTTSTDQNPEHTFRFPGRYVVSLTVSNSTGTATRTEVVLDDS